MGFRFRKSIKAGPLRVNLSKSGVGYSVGTKGFRYTKKAGGGTRTTASIPGTGISYVSDSKKKEAAPVSQEPVKSTPGEPYHYGVINEVKYCRSCHHGNPAGATHCASCGKPMNTPDIDMDTVGKGCAGCLVSCVAFLFLVFSVLVMVGSCSNDAPTPTQPATFATTPTDATMAASITPAPENVTAPHSTENTYVLNTSSMKFHLPSCSNVDDITAANKDTFTGPRATVIALGYEPCGNCDP